MKRAEHLLVKVAEEASEVVQRATKALRFGLDEIQPGQESTNGERLVDEMQDLLAAFAALRKEPGAGAALPMVFVDEIIEQKEAKIEAFLRYSEKFCGTLQP